MIRLCGVILILGLIAWGCATQEPLVSGGKEIGVTKGTFHGRWWNYYERGTSWLAGEVYDEAEADFKKALAGRSRDTWQARTYGLHFVEYFPNRELGVACYQVGRLDEAEQYLETSLEQIDTARAHHYLDLVKRTKIAKGILADTTGPGLRVSLDEDRIVASREVRFNIAASDDIGVANVRVNRRTLYQRGSSETVEFEDSVLFTEGTHEILVTANDLADKKIDETVQVTVDLTGPTIGIFAPADTTVTENASVMLEGVTVDKNGVASVSLGERILAKSSGAPRLEFATELPLNHGENSFLIIAKDIAANETRAAVKVFRGSPDSTAAKLWLLQHKAPHLLQYAQASPEGVPAGLTVGLQLLPAMVDQGPLIKVKSPKRDREQPYRHNKALRVYAKVSSDSPIKSITLNGSPFDVAGAPTEFVDRRIPIDQEDVSKAEMEVPISIQAEDEQGGRSKEEFNVVVRPVELNTRESKMPVAVFAFTGAQTPGLDENLRTKARQMIFNTQRFNLLERDELRAILTEQQLSDALAEESAALTLGRVIPAHAFLVGDVIERGKEAEIVMRAVSTETGEILVILDAAVSDKDDIASIDKGCGELAEQMKNAFPKLSGEVTNVSGEDVYVNWTAEDGIRERMHLLVVEEVPPEYDEDGLVEKEGESIPIGEAWIEKILENNSKAKPIRVEEALKVEDWAGKPVVTM